MAATVFTFPIRGTAETAPIVVYQVIDRQTGSQVGKNYVDRKRARSRADKLDNAYGAYRYGVERKELN